jgi:hypothetical protein
MTFLIGDIYEGHGTTIDPNGQH